MILSKEQVGNFVRAVFGDGSEFKQDHVSVDLEHLIACWENILEQGTGVAYGEYENGEPIGFLLGFHSADPMTGIFTAYEYFWLVKKEKRGTGAGLRLLDEFERHAKIAQCGAAVIGCNNVYKHEVLGQMYERLGYSFSSKSYWRSL